MALTTYTELKAAIADWLDRSDLTTVIPDFITLAEASIKHDKNTRFLASEARSQATLSTSTQYLALPSDFVRVKRMHIVSSPQKNIQIVSRSVLNDYYISSAGKPSYAAVTDGQFEFDRIPDSAYTVEIIYDKFNALSGANETNEVYPEYSDIYLYGSLIHAAVYLRDAEMKADAVQAYLNAVDVARKGDKSSRYAGGLRARTVVNI